jgi:hypothetical protein
MRLLRFRIKDATLSPVGSQMTIVRVSSVADLISSLIFLRRSTFTIVPEVGLLASTFVYVHSSPVASLSHIRSP